MMWFWWLPLFPRPPPPINAYLAHYQLFEQFCDSLDDASMLGSLVRLEELFERKLRAHELKKTIDTYVEKKRDDGIDETTTVRL